MTFSLLPFSPHPPSGRVHSGLRTLSTCVHPCSPLSPQPILWPKDLNSFTKMYSARMDRHAVEAGRGKDCSWLLGSVREVCSPVP